MHLVNGTGISPSLGRPTPGVVKQDKSSGGSVDTTKTRSDPQRVRMSSGERPIGAAKGKQIDTEALCHPPPPCLPSPLPPVTHSVSHRNAMWVSQTCPHRCVAERRLRLKRESVGFGCSYVSLGIVCGSSVAYADKEGFGTRFGTG